MTGKLIYYIGVGISTLSFAFAQQASINPLQPGSVNTPIATTQANRPLTPNRVGQNAGVQEANAINASAQPVPNAAVVDTAASTPGAAGGIVIPTEAARHLWRIRPVFSAGVTFDDNIYISHTNRVSDVIWSVSGGATFELGDYRKLKDNYLIASWVGTGYFYTENPGQNAFNQSAALICQYRWNKLTAVLESRYQYLTGPDRQIGNFVSRNVFLNALRFTYDYSDKTALNAEFDQSTQLYQSYLNQYEYQAKLGATYQILPKIKVGVEGVGGILDVEDSPLQVYEQGRVNGRYDITGKLAFKFSGGLEFRQVQSGAKLYIDPVFSLGLEYRPFSDTTVNLLGYRNVFGSATSQSQNYVATGFEISVGQKLFQRFTIALATGYENDAYYGTTNSTSTNLVYNYYFLRPSITYQFIEHLSGAIFYEYRNNESNEVNSQFYENRAGFELAYQF